MLVTWISRKGGRRINEDTVGRTMAGGILCVVAADGLGGYEGGKVASKLAVDTILGEFEKSPQFSKEAVCDYIRTANAAIIEKAENDELYTNMSSTIALLLVKGRRAIWATVGDSRVYMLRKKWICEVSEDHSLAFNDFIEGRIEYDDIRTSPNQNKLTSALGVAAVTPRVSEVRVVDSDTSFLLCTDGWWEYVTEDDMEDTAKTARNGRDWISAMVEIRDRNAPENSDNYSAIAVYI